MPRFDTLVSVNGSVAALLAIAHRYGYPAIGIDEAFPGTQEMMEYIHDTIDSALIRGLTPHIFCSVVSYNVYSSIQLLKELKARYGNRIRTGVGGQLIRCAPRAYAANPDIDMVAIGDAEATLLELLHGVPLSTRWAKHYSLFSYHNYWKIHERLDAMAADPDAPFPGMRQLVMESSRGCAWAYTMKRACSFCSLQSITDKPQVDFTHMFTQECMLIQQGANWVFDVANQWLPVMRPVEQFAYLETFLAERERQHIPADLKRYVYLTTNSITERTAPLLYEAGVRIAYVGFDGWNAATLRAHNKTRHSAQLCIESAVSAGIGIRGALVIGDGASEESLDLLPRFVSKLADTAGNKLVSLACYPVVVLPGSPVWMQFQARANRESIAAANELFQHFAVHGYHTPEQERELTRIYMKHTPGCAVTLEQAEEAVVAVQEMLRSRTKALNFRNQKVD